MVKKRVYKAKTDDEFLEQLAFITFIAGFRYSLVEERWPRIKKAFLNFSIQKISKFKERDIEKLMRNKNMIKNRQKIEAVVENAKMLAQIKNEYGSVINWLAEIVKISKEGVFHRTPLAEEFQQFKRIGKTTSGWLESLYSQPKSYLEYEM